MVIILRELGAQQFIDHCSPFTCPAIGTTVLVLSKPPQTGTNCSLLRMRAHPKLTLALTDLTFHIPIHRYSSNKPLTPSLRASHVTTCHGHTAALCLREAFSCRVYEHVSLGCRFLKCIKKPSPKDLSCSQSTSPFHPVSIFIVSRPVRLHKVLYKLVP